MEDLRIPLNPTPTRRRSPTRYNLVSVLHLALEGGAAYDKYFQDTEQEDDQELANFFRQVQHRMPTERSMPSRCSTSGRAKKQYPSSRGRRPRLSATMLPSGGDLEGVGIAVVQVVDSAFQSRLYDRPFEVFEPGFEDGVVVVVDRYRGARLQQSDRLDALPSIHGDHDAHDLRPSEVQ